MIDSVYAPPKSDLAVSGADANAPAFYVVSPGKMMALFITTLGFYSFYWHYQNWARYKQHERRIDGDDRNIWPVARSFFSIFFTHALLREAQAYGRLNDREVSTSVSLVATAMVVLSIAINVLNKIPETSPYSNLAAMVQLGLLLPWMFAHRAATGLINDACGDPEGKSNSAYSGVNILFIVLGSLFWILVLIGLFMGQQG